MAIRLFRKKDESDRKIKIPEGMWIKCDACLEIIYKPEVERNLNVCPKCVYHFRIPARERIRAVIDEGTFVEFGEEMESVDVLNFTDTKKYVDRLKEAKKTGAECLVTGCYKCLIHLNCAQVNKTQVPKEQIDIPIKDLSVIIAESLES